MCTSILTKARAILGGDHIKPGGDLVEGLQIVVGSDAARTIDFVGFYPMALTTEPNVYLRTDLRNTGLEMASLQSRRDNTDTHSSNILAKIPMSQITSFRPQEHECFVFVQGRTITH